MKNYLFDVGLVVYLILQDKIGNVLSENSVRVLVHVWVYWNLVVFFAVVKKKVEIFFGEYLEKKKGGF